ncbi:hypothetical protein J437_LFUL002928 [Ladona fulva]|uniref:tRNA (guanine(26)-N(2))-dimethyltransferase n=1 Tax=Ladona fulva TaxID=123851 RepID=A0A8K0K9K1_LADFU|nr:hypothetical protein J437_LFUL002928 [Ladona fulva]
MDVKEVSGEIPLKEEKSVCNDPSVVKEGKAEILLSSSKKVFYNPVQEFNRDLSVAVLKLFAEDHRETLKNKKKQADPILRFLDNEIPQEGVKYEGGIKILEALAASGLRSIRYAKEIPGVNSVLANDLSAKAVESIKSNITHNGVDDIVKTNHEDASMLMYSHRKPTHLRFDAVDLDPYGCPSIFLDAAVQCVSDGGLLLVTATDMAVLAGNSPESCHTKYGSISLKNKACHEMALRILLQCIESHANRYGRYIVPLLSLSADFYIRVFVKVYTGQVICKRSTSKLSLVYQCTGCETITLQQLGIMRQVENHIKFSLPAGPPVGQKCKHCGHKHHVGGPIWSDPIHDGDFLARLEHLVSQEKVNLKYGTAIRMEGVIALLREELLDVPLSALLNAGYRVSLSHACRTSVKTDAPSDLIWKVLRAWEVIHPVKRDRLAPNSPALAILSGDSDKKEGAKEGSESSDSVPEVSFQHHPDANPPSRRRGLVRFQENPAPNWGPGTRATAMTESNRNNPKREKNQGRKRERSSPGISNKVLRVE